MALIITILRHGKSVALWNFLVFVCFCIAWQREGKFWTATSKLSIPQMATPQAASDPFDASPQGDQLNSLLLVVNPLKTQAEILASENLLKKVLERDPESGKFSGINQYKKFFNIKLSDDSNIFSINVRGITPDVVLQRAQLVTQTYQQHLNDLRSSDVASRQAFYQADLKRASQDLSEAEYELARYRKASGLVDTQKQAEAIISLISDLKKIQELALLEANRDAGQIRALADQPGLLPQGAVPAVDESSDPNYQLVRQELRAVAAELKEKRTQLTESHPYIKILLSSQVNLRQQLKQYGTQTVSQRGTAPLTEGEVKDQQKNIQQIALLEQSASTKRKQAQNLELRISLLESNLRSLPRQQSRLDALKRRVSVSKRTFNKLVSQVESSRADAFKNYPSVQLLNGPTLNPTPTSNRFGVAIYSLVTAGLGSIALLLLLERRNPLLKPRDLSQTPFPVATRIPKLQPSTDPNETILSLSGGEAAFLKMAYGLLIQEIPDRCLMVSSAISGEGKTTVALHLAKALEALGLKVLVLREEASADEASEASQILLESIVDQTPRVSSRFQVGEPESGKMQVAHFEFSSRSRFEAKVKRIVESESYDFVIFDSPPVQSGNTAALMSMVISNILLVIRPGQSTRFAVQDTLQLLSPSQLNLVGLVINDPGYFGLSNRKGWEENFSISQSNIAPVKIAA